MHKVKEHIKTGIEFTIRRCSFSIASANAIILIISAIILYPLIPNLLNCPPDYLEYLKSFCLPYSLQYSMLAFFSLASVTAFTFLSVRDIDPWHKISAPDTPGREEKLSAIRRKCLNLPYRLYLYQIMLPALILLVYSLIFTLVYKFSIFSFFQILLIVMTFFSMTALINLLFSKKIFTEILYRIGAYNHLEGKSLNLCRKMLLQILPVSIVSILFTSMLCYSRLIEDRGNFLFKLYKTQLEMRFEGFSPNNVYEIAGRLSDIDIDGTASQYFIFNPRGDLVSYNGPEVSHYFIQYMQKYSDAHKGRIYDQMMHYNGAVIKIGSSSGTWSAGVRYKLSLDSAMFYMESNFIILVLLILLIIYLSSRAITTDISTVASSLEDIAAGWNVKSGQRIPITSNDEMGELVLAINKLRDCEHEYDAMKNEFIANISHEFRTPLNIILNALQLSIRYVKNSTSEENAAKINVHMYTMKQNCYRLLKLINNIIDSTKMDANFFKLHRQNCNIVADVRFIASSVSDYIKEREISLEFKSNTDMKIIAVDMDALERIMLNLLSNAVKFSKKGSVITVAVIDRGDNVDISVKDTGIGIPEEKLQSVFKRFAQVGGTLTRSHEGSGIGLSIVKSLVEMQNGSISVSSRQGEGTEFVVSFPVVILPFQLDGEDDYSRYESRFQSGIERIDIEFSDL